MTEFYGTVTGRALRGGTGTVSRVGDKATGLRAVASSMRGAVHVELAYDKATGKARYTIEQRPHLGAGIGQHIASGFLGELDRGAAERMAACATLDRLAAAFRNRGRRSPSDMLAEIGEALRASGRDTAPAPIAPAAATAEQP